MRFRNYSIYLLVIIFLGCNQQAKQEDTDIQPPKHKALEVALASIEKHSRNENWENNQEPRSKLTRYEVRINFTVFDASIGELNPQVGLKKFPIKRPFCYLIHWVFRNL